MTGVVEEIYVAPKGSVAMERVEEVRAVKNGGLEGDRPRPPCKHIQDLTEPGMTRALRGRGGICARVVEDGRIRARDEIAAL